MDKDKRVIEDYLPVEAIEAEAQLEKRTPNGRGLISLLHLRWTRCALVATRRYDL